MPDKNNESNLSTNKWKNLIELKTDKSATIKEADKWSVLVVMDTQYYKNINTFHAGKQYLLWKNRVECRNKDMGILFSIQMRGKILAKKEIDYLSKFEYRSYIFYGLTKIHKIHIENFVRTYKDYAITPTDFKPRSIVAGQIWKITFW